MKSSGMSEKDPKRRTSFTDPNTLLPPRPPFLLLSLSEICTNVQRKEWHNAKRATRCAAEKKKNVR